MRRLGESGMRGALEAMRATLAEMGVTDCSAGRRPAAEAVTPTVRL
jgi:hypothetical protein